MDLFEQATPPKKQFKKLKVGDRILSACGEIATVVKADDKDVFYVTEKDLFSGNFNNTESGYAKGAQIQRASYSDPEATVE